MAIKDVEGIYYHDGDLITVILELMYSILRKSRPTRLDTAKSRPSR